MGEWPVGAARGAGQRGQPAVATECGGNVVGRRDLLQWQPQFGGGGQYKLVYLRTDLPANLRWVIRSVVSTHGPGIRLAMGIPGAVCCWIAPLWPSLPAMGGYPTTHSPR